MYKDIFPPIVPTNEAKQKKQCAPPFEKYASKVEEETFMCPRENRVFDYKILANAIKTFGFAGITQLGPKQMQVCFNQIELSNEAHVFYFDKFGGCEPQQYQIPVEYCLHLFVLLCSHGSQQEQIDQMWLLVNPQLNEEIDAATMLQLVRSLAEIAVLQTRKRIEGIEP